MIKNEKQYKITRKKLRGLQQEIATIKARQEPLPATERLIIVSSEVMQQQLEAEIADYERLKSYVETITLKERNLAELPSLITEYRIISGMTQKEFSQKIGMKEQQLQRYEAEDYKSISFANLLKILLAIGLDIVIKDTLINKRNNLPSGRNESIA